MLPSCVSKWRAKDIPPWLRPIFATLTCCLCWRPFESWETDIVKERLAIQRAVKEERRKDQEKDQELADLQRTRAEYIRKLQAEQETAPKENGYWPVTHPCPIVNEVRREQRRERARQRRERRSQLKAESEETPPTSPQGLAFPKPDPAASPSPSLRNITPTALQRADLGPLRVSPVAPPISPETLELFPTQSASSAMPNREEVTYFGAGPALLPTPVLEKAAQALVNYQSTGLGIAEHSHRSALATDIVNNTKADLKKYLDVPEDYEVLLMQAGGSGEFSATVYNFVGIWVERRRQKILKDLGIAEGQEIPEADLAKELQKAVDEELKLDYLVTGSWSLKASQEAARLLGPEKVNVAADARKVNDGKFGKIPEESTWTFSKKPAMIYYCDNETVDGVEFPGFPKSLEPGEDEPIVVADMSSNILSRRIPIKNFSLIFFGAQKNLGSTGITVVVIKKNLLPPLLATPKPSLMRRLGLPIGPIVLDYATIEKNNSLYNTLSIFDVYVAGEVLKSLLAKYPNKVDGQEAVSDEKAKIIYAALDAHPESYRVVPDKTVRSRMNICFRVTHLNNDLDASEKAFLKGAQDIGLQGLKGHRSVGGIRASNYNSIDLEGAKKLAGFIEAFAKTPKA